MHNVFVGSTPDNTSFLEMNLDFHFVLAMDVIVWTQAWGTFYGSVCTSLYDEQHPTSLYPTIDWFYARRCEAVVAARCGHTRYWTLRHLFCTMSTRWVGICFVLCQTLSWYLLCTMSTRWVGICFVLCQHAELVYFLYYVNTISWYMFCTMSKRWVGICFLLCQHAELVSALYYVNMLSWYMFCT